MGNLIKVKKKHYQVYQQTLMYGNGHILCAEFIAHPELIELAICMN